MTASAVDLFVACSTVGKGRVPVLPVELREKIAHFCKATALFVPFRCAACRTVVGYASTNASFDDLLRLPHLCLGCYQNGRRAW